MALVIDAHQHFWQLSQSFDFRWLDRQELSRIKRDCLPEDLLPHLESAGVDYTVFVQTQHDLAENRWALKLADQHDFIAGVVGWVDLADPRCEEQLAEFAQHPKFVGVRHLTQDEDDDDFIIRPEIIRGLQALERHNLPFDLLFYVKHLKHAMTLAQKLPDLRMVIDHLAKPRIRDGAMDDWIDDFRAAGRFPNLYCKLSGMVTEAHWQEWTSADLKPYIETALEVFGCERCMYGSDWPVCELAASYEQVYQALAESVGPLSPQERESLFGNTARNFYKLACP